MTHAREQSSRCRQHLALIQRIDQLETLVKELRGSLDQLDEQLTELRITGAVTTVRLSNLQMAAIALVSWVASFVANWLSQHLSGGP